MKPVCWSHLLPDPMVLDAYPTEQIVRICSTAECEGMSVAHGISAVGELLAFTADAGELSDDTARNIGWLIKSLGALSGRLVDVSNGAEYELERRRAPNKDERK